MDMSYDTIRFLACHVMGSAPFVLQPVDFQGRGDGEREMLSLWQ